MIRLKVPKLWSALGLAWATAIPAFADEPKAPESMGPLQRFDPAPETFPGLISVQGKPRRGLPSAPRYGLQRMGNQDKWCVEAGAGLVVIERNLQSGEMEAKDSIGAQDEWCLSPDGTKLFAHRKPPGPFTPRIAECFDFQSGKSLWTCETTSMAADVAFTLDGKQVMILHPGGGETLISWYDAETGARTRQVKIPGPLYQVVGDLNTDYIGVTKHAVYVTVPREKAPSEVWMIKEGSDEAVKQPLQLDSSPELAQILVGGANRELVAVYHEDMVELLREETTGLTHLHTTELPAPKPYGSFPKSVRFSPDHTQLFVSTRGKSWLISTKQTSQPVIKEYNFGWRLGDYTRDGKYYVSIDDGGGVIRNRETLQREDRAALANEPAHCCPIVDAGYSMNDRLIISNDERNLILWTKEGKLLAELISPNEKLKGCSQMQSPIFVDRVLKVYAADGFDFLEWDLREIAAQTKRPGGISPRVEGRPVFRDRKTPNEEPEVMNISIDASGKNLITATSQTFIYRPFDTPDKKTVLQVPKRDIVMLPRTVYQSDTDPKILVQSAGDVFELDPAGKEKAVTLNNNTPLGLDPKTKRFFNTYRHDKRTDIVAVPYGMGQQVSETMPLPAEWGEVYFTKLLISADGRLLVGCRGGSQGSCLTVIDWANKKVIRDIPLHWSPTSIALSRDDSRVMVGSHNRSIYTFDLKSLRESAE